MYDTNIKPAHRMWRTLVRIEQISSEKDGIYFVLPAFSPDKLVFCPRKAIPPYVFSKMLELKEIRYYVMCNIGAETEDKICFDCWEYE